VQCADLRRVVKVAGDAGSKKAKSSIDDFAFFGYAGF